MTPLFSLHASVDMNGKTSPRFISVSLRRAWRGSVAGLAMACCMAWAAGDPLGKVAKAFHSILGAEGKADVWGYNAYSNPAVMGKNIHEAIRSGGYVSKFGVLVEVGLNAPFSGDSRALMEQKQAAGMVQTYLTTLSDGWVKRISWFILQAGRSKGSEIYNIFDGDWTPKPVAAAYLVLADTLRAGKVEKRITLSGGGEFFIWRRIDNSVVGVGWAPGEENITLDTGGASCHEN